MRVYFDPITKNDEARARIDKWMTGLKPTTIIPAKRDAYVSPRLDQIQLLRCADAVLQPSLFEGWSTVVEDARALGKRIFLSDIPVHREQNPPGAVYFDPNEPADLAAAIDREWNNLTPGPCEDEEMIARERQGELIAAYARDLMAIADELVELYRR